MEAVEEAMGSNSSDYSNSLAKAKRMKQQRRKRNHHSSPAMADSSSASSAVLSETITEEDEDMAICLMLLAQGRTSMPKREASPPPEEPAAVAADDGDGGSNIIIHQAAAAAAIGVYECKTCNKCFTSFQALGGHRASHKKPKLEKKQPPIISLRTAMDSISTSLAAVAAPQGSKYCVKANKIHECSLCGSEFSSGQALGGHMRRHRPAVNIPDLNLPAAPLPAADDVPYAFPRGERQLLFPASASALVGCHY